MSKEKQIKLMAAENILPWVAGLRASFRYIAGGIIIFGAISTLYMPKLDTTLFEAIWNLAGSVFSFMFGDRMYFKFAKR